MRLAGEYAQGALQESWEATSFHVVGAEVGTDE